MEDLLLLAIKASQDAGVKILEVYESDFAVEHKEDKSPLTLADKNSHHAIVAYLLETDVPVLSEEGKSIDYNERKNWDKLWVVDPLDGTKEFIKRNGEFTVNIALVEKGQPVMGVIYVPVKDEMYFSWNAIGAYKVDNFSKVYEPDDSLEQLKEKASKLPLTNGNGKFTVVASRSHMSPETEEFINRKKEEHGEVDLVSAGSSLKLCMVAEGKANVYPRFAPTMEWDTAAGQAIAEGAGCTVTQKDEKTPLQYNKEDLLNPWFVVTLPS